MSIEMFMVCEEEQLEPWQCPVIKEEEEDVATQTMDVVCAVEQQEVVNGPGLDLSTPSPPTHLQVAPQIASRLAHGISSSWSNHSQGLSFIGPSVTQGTSLIGSNLVPHMSVIGPNGPTVPSISGSQISQAMSTIGSNLNPGNIVMGSNITARTPVTGTQFSLTTSLIHTNCAPATSTIGTNVPAGTSAISGSLPQGQPLILTQGPGGTFFLSTGQISTAPGQIPGSAPNQPLLFTTQSLRPINLSKILLKLQGGQTTQPFTLIPQQPTVRAKIPPKEGNAIAQTKASEGDDAPKSPKSRKSDVRPHRKVWRAIEEQLVSMVENRPALFAVANKNYISLPVRTENWRQISEKMNISERVLRKRWATLRTEFCRYRKLPPSTSRQKWVLQRLQFLVRTRKRKEGTSDLAHREPTAPTDTSTGASADASLDGPHPEEHQTSATAQSPMCDTETSKAPSTSTGPPAKRSRPPQRDDGSKVSQDLMRLIGAALEKKPAEEKPPQDFIAVACKGIEHKFRMLPPHLVPRLEHKIQNLIWNFCEEHNLTHNLG